MALVFAVEAREGEGEVGAGAGVVHGGVEGEGGEVRAGGGAGFVGAVGAVAVIVVEAGEGEGDGGGGYAGEGGVVFVELCDYRGILAMGDGSTRACKDSSRSFHGHWV